MKNEDEINHDYHEYCDRCGDCFICDVPHTCLICNDCFWKCNHDEKDVNEYLNNQDN